MDDHHTSDSELPERGLHDAAADPALRAAVTADFRASTPLRGVALCGVVFWLAYEWGIGNEVVTPWLLARVINDRPGVEAIPAAIFVGFVFTVVQQLLAGVTALAGFSMFDRTAHAAWQRLRAQFGAVPGEWSGLGLLSRSVLVFGLGTTAVALVQITTTGEVGVRRHRRAVTESAVLCGAIVALVAGAVGALAVVGRQIEMLAPFTEWMLRVLGNPLFWLGLLVLVAIVNVVRHRASSSLVEPDSGQQEPRH
jgi:hypothetical protein